MCEVDSHACHYTKPTMYKQLYLTLHLVPGYVIKLKFYCINCTSDMRTLMV